ncbi:hypothetical protein OGAPHI_003082 [Ogataea philodendri]|uniref:Mitochondrial 15S rRNA processing factor CCM1 n=1 Tax=Ogataea philodendri TaxID=1378263 RepID=A0A9P8P7Z1_9ASCO|nr:uncharacterized protein OGAPHI_003082 [Ogataea philodendri]KAH3667433.1 hypothetical protein OGAPHI_003082 [Ogataea philodendri]
MLGRTVFGRRAPHLPICFVRTVVFNRRPKTPRSSAAKIEAQLTQQIKNLEQFTMQVENTVKQNKDTQIQRSAADEFQVHESQDVADEEAELLFESLMSSNDADPALSLGPGDSSGQAKGLSMFPDAEPHTQLPPVIRTKLDPETIKHITVSDGANWVPVVDRLHQTTGLSGCTPVDVLKLLTTIPRSQRPAVVSKIHEMALSAKLLKGLQLYNSLMSSYNLVKVQQAQPIIEKMYAEMLDKGIKPNLITYGIMINLYSKLLNVDKVREFMDLIRSDGYVATKEVYTTILQMYVRMNNYRQVLDVFSTMKFLSLDTSPSARTYSSVILMDVLNNNVEHALTLYDEMVDRKIEVEPQALLALAKGCSTRQPLIERGWGFIIEYYTKKYPMDSKVVEMMMVLAYKDSDLNLARALFVGLFDTLTKAANAMVPPSPVALRYLFNAYTFYNPDRVPVSRLNHQIRDIAARTLDMCDFSFHKNAPPFLPTLELADPDLGVVEARAIFEYFVLHFPHMISLEVLEAYLFVHALKGHSIDEFEQLWERHTFFKGQTVTVEEPKGEQPEQSEQSEQPEQLDETPASASSAPSTIAARRVQIKYPRNDQLYNACMHAARINKDVAFAQKIWTERGQYRKSPEFQKLSPHKQDQLDFKFARAIVSVFVETNNLTDAFQVILSSQGKFAWTYYHLKSVVALAEKLDQPQTKRELLQVASLAEKRQRKHHSM